MGKVISKPFIERDGKRILQCHSRGHRQFSPFFCWVEAYGLKQSIENHYQCSKVFDGYPEIQGWKDAKELQDKGIQQIGWTIGGIDFDLKPNDSEFRYALDDWGIQWYIALWYKFLKQNPYLIDIAAQYDDFEDPFKGKFPFCQADVIRKVVREGLPSLLPMCSELLEKLR